MLLCRLSDIKTKKESYVKSVKLTIKRKKTTDKLKLRLLIKNTYSDMNDFFFLKIFLKLLPKVKIKKKKTSRL